MKLWLIFVFLIILGSSAFALDVDMDILKVSCDDSGKLTLVVDSITGYLIKTDTIEMKAVFEGKNEDEEDVPAFYFPVKADAQHITPDINVTLKSNEAVFNWSGMYRLSISYEKDNERIKFPYEIGCPGLLFSCKTADLEIVKCSNDRGKFDSEIYIRNLDILEGVDPIENVNFFLEAEKPYENVDGEFASLGGLAKSFSMTNKDENTYVIVGDFRDNIVKVLIAEFEYNDCELVSEKKCDGEFEVSSVTGATTTEATGEMASELEKKRQEVAEAVKKDLEAYENSKLSFLKWILLGVLILGGLGGATYILFKRKANKKLRF